jgi:hypothetical protein
MLNKTGFLRISATVLLLFVSPPAGSAEKPKLADQAIADAIEDRYRLDRTLDVNRI